MKRFKAEILKFGEMGEKTGWTYFIIPAAISNKVKPDWKRSYRVKGLLDKHPIKGIALLPMGEGDFIMPLNTALRKAIRKKHGDSLQVQLEEDKTEFVLNPDMMLCLADEPEALKNFKKQPGSHQRYFSKWIDSVRSDTLKARRIAQTVNAMLRGQNFAEMLRSLKNNR